jgi:CheY-like chemotaxis protein
MTSEHRWDRRNGPQPPLAHELNTALSMIVGFAELLETRDDAETRAEATRGIVQAATRLRGLVESIAGTSLDEPLFDDEPIEFNGAPDRHRVLVIDDNPTELEVLRAAFPQDEFDLLEVRDADEAFQVLDAARPDFVILDWKLPGGGGAETLAELKLRKPDLPVVVLGEAGDPKQRQIATLLDAEDYLPRPFNPVELLGRIEELAT